jgi:hypothetical protein
LGLPDPDSFARGTDPDRDSDPDLGPFIIKKKKKKTLISIVFFILFNDILYLKNDVNVVMHLQKKQKSIFFGILKVTDENSRIWI